MSATLVYHFLLGGLPRQRRGGFSPALRLAGVGAIHELPLRSPAEPVGRLSRRRKPIERLRQSQIIYLLRERFRGRLQKDYRL